MKPRLVLSSVLLVGLVAVSGCKDNRTERVAASYSSVSKPTLLPGPVRVTEKTAVGVDAIPTEEDYEERAATSITEANLARKLAELEKEMAF
jgi:hypothetical protein